MDWSATLTLSAIIVTVSLALAKLLLTMGRDLAEVKAVVTAQGLATEQRIKTLETVTEKLDVIMRDVLVSLAVLKD